MLTLQENLLFQLGVLDLVILDQNILSDCLNSILLTSLGQLSQENLAKSSSPQQANQLEILILNTSQSRIAITNQHWLPALVNILLVDAFTPSVIKVIATPGICRKNIVIDVATAGAALRFEFRVVLLFTFNFECVEAQFVVGEIENASLLVLLVVSLFVEVEVFAGDVVDSEGDVSVEVDEAELEDLD